MLLESGGFPILLVDIIVIECHGSSLQALPLHYQNSCGPSTP